MALAFTIGLFLLVLLSVALYGYRLYARPVRIHERLGAAVTQQMPATLSGVGPPTGKTWMVRVVQQIGEKAPISPQDATMTRRLLIAAGHRTDSAVRLFYGVKIALAAALFIGVLIGRAYISNPVLSIVIIPGGVLAGWFLPNFVVERLIDRRQEAMRLSLPDALDLMVVCMEAGLGLDQAIANVSRELRTTHPEIAEELSLVTLEMRAGKRRVEALKNLADRTAEPELRKLVATMIQADRFGTGVAESLRTHSEFMRVRRRQMAEERAAKVGVKLVFPIFFFILPSMLVVAAGPGMLQLFKQLVPMMKGFGQ